MKTTTTHRSLLHGPAYLAHTSTVQDHREGRGTEGRVIDVWLGGPTGRLLNPADVLSKNAYLLALGLVSLAYWRCLVRIVRGGQATCYGCGPQNPGADLSINKHRFAGFLLYADCYFVYGNIYP